MTHLTQPALRIAVILLAAVLLSGPAAANESTCASCDVVAQAQEREGSGSIEPRYQPREPEPEGYDDTYLFGMTRGVLDSTIHPAGQLPLLLFTFPLDIALLPIAAIVGFF